MSYYVDSFSGQGWSEDYFQYDQQNLHQKLRLAGDFKECPTTWTVLVVKPGQGWSEDYFRYDQQNPHQKLRLVGDFQECPTTYTVKVVKLSICGHERPSKPIFSDSP